jgi:hypothetical protein
VALLLEDVKKNAEWLGHTLDYPLAAAVDTGARA